MEQSRFEQLRGRFEGHRPLAEADVVAFEQRVGPVPLVLRRLWTEVGLGELHADQAVVSLYGPSDIEAFVEDTYAESLPGLIPFASDGGSWDYCWVHASASEPGLVIGSVLYVSRGDLSWEGCIPVGKDDTDFFDRLLIGHDPFDLPALGKHWSLAHAHLAALPPGLTHEHVDVVELYYRTLSPRELRPKVAISISGLPCRAGRRVLLSMSGAVQVCTLAEPTRLAGVLCAAGSEVVIRGSSLHRFVPVEPLEVDGIRWAADNQVTLPDGISTQRSGVLAEPQVLDGIPLAAEAVRLDSEFRVVTGTLAEACEVDGLALPAGSRFERMIDPQGAARVFSARAPVAWQAAGREIEANERFYPHEHRAS